LCYRAEKEDLEPQGQEARQRETEMAKIPTDYRTEREESKNRDQELDRKRWRRKKAGATGQREGGPKRWGHGASQTKMEKEATQKKKITAASEERGPGEGSGHRIDATGP